MIDQQPLISVVSPVYRAEKIVDELVKRLIIELEKITSNYEIILVDDFSPDESWSKIADNCGNNDKVKGIKLSRNFGQHYAIKAGLNISKGDCCVVMDCDLQDDPKYIYDLVSSWEQGNEIVFTLKVKREHSSFKNVTAFVFNKVFNYLADTAKGRETSGKIGSYSLISRKVIEAFKNYNDYQFHYLMVLRWLGFKRDYIEIEHSKRYEGTSSYNFKKLMNHAVVGIVYQSDKLLRMSIYIGFFISCISVLSTFYVIAKYFITGSQPGWTSLFVLMLLLFGFVFIAIGILGLYIGKMFEQVKNRPQYIIDKTLNL